MHINDVERYRAAKDHKMRHGYHLKGAVSEFEGDNMPIVRDNGDENRIPRVDRLDHEEGKQLFHV